jgi:REP element-mobilizing transposase RayT
LELKAVCLDIEVRYQIKFLEIGTDRDHVHFLVQSVPTYSVTKLVTLIKNLTAREIFNLETTVGRTKVVQVLDVHGRFKKFVVTYMDVGNAENAGAIFCHLVGDENFFTYVKGIRVRCIKKLCRLA